MESESLTRAAVESKLSTTMIRILITCLAALSFQSGASAWTIESRTAYAEPGTSMHATQGGISLAQATQVFFDELGIPAPKYNLAIEGGGHGEMTGRMLEGVEKILQDESPDCLMVYGDTNSTLAGALAAAKLHIPVVHIEAGL